MIKVRFAPSPTGRLHIGAARTAIYNWLFARHHGGEFLLRIEDTDTARSSTEMIQGILDGLQWLGLDWDQGPIFQSQRTDLHRQKAQELLDKGAAYYCYCQPEELEQRKKDSSSQEYWEYDRRCLHLTPEQKQAYENDGRPRALRFKVPDQDITYQDLIHGKVHIKSNTLEDFVLLRRDGQPTYHLSVVVDDIDLGITHIIRGSDHLSNTPKQILLYRALDAPLPEFAHQSLIFGPDKKKLSKRHGVTSVLQFRDDGFLPLALLNYLAQMSWSPGEERIYTREEMKIKFFLDKRSRGNPVFDQSKLEWMNGLLISQMPAAELFPLIKTEWIRSGLWNQEWETKKLKWLYRLIDLLKERSRRISDFSPRAAPFLTDEFTYEKEAVEKYLSDERLGQLLPGLTEQFSRLEDFSSSATEDTLRKFADSQGVKAALLIHAIRVLTLGTKVSPGIFEVLELIGREKTLIRLKGLEKVRSGDKNTSI